ncbi:MAG: hypothetical protein JNG89_16175 [Planctomycetaceae bacterium]|nr:hypothetical protein [Planctomycetaceae bacterium]
MYAYCILPVDWLTTNYNVRRIMAGDPAPSVQISVHPLSAEGLLQLRPLLACDDAVIRDGIRVMLAEELVRLEAKKARSAAGWTAYQISEQRLNQQLNAIRGELRVEEVGQFKFDARDAFDAYAYQWY